MDTGALFFTNLALLAGALFVLWLVSLWMRNSSIIDVFWGMGFVAVAWLTLWISGNRAPVPLGLTLMVSVWGFRLAGYLGWRNIGKPEDYRYAAMRNRSRNWYPVVSLFTVFWLQGVLACIISLPLQIGINRGGDWTWQASLGAVVWLAGVVFESVGDYQLARFKADNQNKGKVLREGLWRYTRHPNYFGDFLVWWGFYLVAAQPESWWWTILGPALMSFLLVRISGVRLLESSLRSRIEGYEEYLKNTSSFIPLPPRNSHP